MSKTKTKYVATEMLNDIATELHKRLSNKEDVPEMVHYIINVLSERKDYVNWLIQSWAVGIDEEVVFKLLDDITILTKGNRAFAKSVSAQGAKILRAKGDKHDG